MAIVFCLRKKNHVYSSMLKITVILNSHTFNPCRAAGIDAQDNPKGLNSADEFDPVCTHWA